MLLDTRLKREKCTRTKRTERERTWPKANRPIIHTSGHGRTPPHAALKLLARYHKLPGSEACAKPIDKLEGKTASPQNMHKSVISILSSQIGLKHRKGIPLLREPSLGKGRSQARCGTRPTLTSSAEPLRLASQKWKSTLLGIGTQPALMI